MRQQIKIYMQAPQKTLRQKIFSGTAWTLVGMGTSHLLRFGKSLLLTRLLLPDVYGTMAIVWSVLFALGMLSDAGLQAAALRHKDANDSDFMNTIWTMKIFRGLILFVITLFLAYPVSVFYSMPDLSWLIPIAGFSFMLEGFSSTKIYTYQRNMVFGRLTLLEMGNEFIGTIVVIVWAYLQPGVGALIGGAMVNAVIHLTYSHLLVPGQRNSLRWKYEEVQDIFNFGKWILLSSIVYLIYSQGDRMLLGKLATPSELGVYSIAVMLSEVSSGVIIKINYNVVYPALNSIILGDRKKLSSVFYKTRLLTDVLITIPISILLVNAEYVIGMLYNSKYHEAGWMLKFLCIRLLMIASLNSTEHCLLALGKPKYSVAQNISRAIVMVVGTSIGWQIAGFEGFVLMVAMTEVPVLIVLWYGLIKNGIFNFRLEARTALAIIVGLTLGSIIHWIIL